MTEYMRIIVMLQNTFLINTIKNTSFKQHLNQMNSSRVKYFSMLVLLIEISMLVFSFLSPSCYFSNQIKLYRILYLVLLSICAFYLIYDYFRAKHNQWNDYTNYVMKLIAFLGITWGALISLLDVSHGGGIYVYMTFVLMMPLVIYANPLFYFIVLIGVQTMFLLTIEPYSTSMALNSTFFSLFAWLVSRLNYKNEFDKYVKNKLIDEKNRQMETQNEALIRLSQTDYLTGLYNRLSLDSILSRKYFEAYVNQQEFTVLMIDINAFKNFNDTFGHVRGDDCLKKVSHILEEVSVLYSGYAFRYGGDEFCMIFLDIENLESLLSEINEKVSKIYDDVIVSLSIGVSDKIPCHKDVEWQMIEQADLALYEVKTKKGRRREDTNL